MPSKPYQDRETLRKYSIHGLTYDEMTDRLGCSRSTLHRWLKEEHGLDKDLLRRPAYKMTTSDGASGYMEWRHMHDRETIRCRIHRLLAVAEYGFDAACENVVHHKNGIPWDNRPENIELKSNSDHSRDHAVDDNGLDPRVRDPDELRACLDDGMSSEEMCDEFNCSSRTLYKYLNEYDLCDSYDTG